MSEEANQFLNVMLTNEVWKTEIVCHLRQSILDFEDVLNSSKGDYCLGIGALAYFAVNNKRSATLDNEYYGWSCVKMKDARIPEGYIININ